jgi:ABC-2 type transport system ATP-binding protein
VMELIREAAQAGATVLLSSHDLSEVAAVCGRAAILRRGHLVELAPISDIVQKGERHLKISFVKGTKIPPLPTDRLPGARLIRRDDSSLHLAYYGTAEAIIKWLAKFPVDNITTPETSLEEAFIQYYQREDGHEK